MPGKAVRSQSAVKQAVPLANRSPLPILKILNSKLDQLQGMSVKLVYVTGWYGYGFESHSQPFLQTYPEADLTYYF